MEATTSLHQPSQPDPSHPKTHTDPPLPNTIPLKDLSSVQEPEIDQYWEKQTGKIERKRDPAFCRHGEKAMCDYCMPLEVYVTVLYSFCAVELTNYSRTTPSSNRSIRSSTFPTMPISASSSRPVHPPLLQLPIFLHSHPHLYPSSPLALQGPTLHFPKVSAPHASLLR